MKRYIKELSILAKSGSVSEVAAATLYRGYIRNLVPKFMTLDAIVDTLEHDLKLASTAPVLSRYNALLKVKAILTRPEVKLVEQGEDFATFSGVIL